MPRLRRSPRTSPPLARLPPQLPLLLHLPQLPPLLPPPRPPPLLPLPPLPPPLLHLLLRHPRQRRRPRPPQRLTPAPWTARPTSFGSVISSNASTSSKSRFAAATRA